MDIILDTLGQNPEFQNRKLKMDELRSLGINPFPHRFIPSHGLDEVIELFDSKDVGHSEDAEKGETEEMKLSGRLVLFRPMGKNIFAQIQDEKGRLQLMINRDHSTLTGYEPEEGADNVPKPLKVIEKKLDLGDIIGVQGHLFRTNKGELTLYVKELTLLSKSLLPLPDKHSGLNDKELRYRKRWLDMISHTEVMNTFQQRSKIFQLIREFFQSHRFTEVETPVLQTIYGGANASPFNTHLNALNLDMFMRISLEISLKKLLIGGMNKVFEIGKVFRNEGIDKTHNPEFTMLEAYATGWDYEDMMNFCDQLFEKIALTLHGQTKVQIGEHLVDFKAPFKRQSMKEAIAEYAKINVDNLKDEELKALLKEKTDLDPKAIDKASRGLLISFAFEELAEKSLIQPTHIIDHPIETTPLCKPHREGDKASEGLVERFETFILGRELCNSYSELNDPLLQHHLLDKQAKERQAGDDEAHPMDEEFIEAMCQAMPPAGGIGIGLDRLVMLFTNKESIRDVLFFPVMRPEHHLAEENAHDKKTPV